MTNNKVAGTWMLTSAKLNAGGNKTDMYGEHPGGYLIFTEDLHFSVVINNPDIPKFASGDRAEGTPEENKTAVVNSLGLYGTYTVDSHGDFSGEHVIGSTFPNWNDLRRETAELTETVKGDTMYEQLKLPNGAVAELVWKRV